jgi:AraC-like DNA-binding protein
LAVTCPITRLLGAALSQSALGALLLTGGAQQVETMTPRKQMGLLQSARSLALTALESAYCAARGQSLAVAEGARERRERREQALYTAALRHIARHLPDTHLSPESIAQAIGCSRCSLYRMFEQNGQSVSGYVRERRLDKLLKSHGRTAPISALAARCGLFDGSPLTRAFKRQFGVLLREVR